MANVSSSPKLSGMKWRVVSTLGTGAGSTILQISDKGAGGKRYALKIVKRDDENEENPNVYIDQAMTEYEAAQKLNHAAIAKVYDLRVKRSWFKVSGVELLLEYVDGKTLDEIEAPEMGQLVLVFCQVASAIAHMHRRGVFHGDLKPANIMLSKTGKVKLIDFGTAWIRNRDKNRAGGTPQYVAPEQVTEKVVDAKTDIYNFGATMYRMFSGRFANQGLPKPGEGSGKKLVPPVKINPKIPAGLNELIIACLEYGPERRPNDMFEVAQKLSAIAKSMGLEEVDLKGAEEDE
jgi:serine/threonine-protein kinase